NVVILGSKLGQFWPGLEWGFYISLFGLLGWLLVPSFKVLLSPSLKAGEIRSWMQSGDESKLSWLARGWLQAGFLQASSRVRLEAALVQPSELPAAVEVAFGELDDALKAEIKKHALMVFLSTSISQNGRLDALSVLAFDFRLIHRLAKTCGYRPSILELSRLYIRIFAATLIAGAVEDLDVGAVAARVTEASISSIPGIDLMAPAVGIAMKSATEGTINGMVTLRLGYVTKAILLERGLHADRAELRREANVWARQEIRPLTQDEIRKRFNPMKHTVNWLNRFRKDKEP
ncbi:MAG: DUF697 domain-containing protein, partial [Opitutaceae bacterium]|nr:DUF697 domain-containing protein [Opitutaceae bacterium]